jgi:bifunctional UDP-N-acetylglucosamine pyrophosphorylase/glucosamine-1-phosphate N-acetyltransferase
MNARDVGALVLAAGRGTRMKSSRPKVLFEVGGEPMVAWVVRAARAAGAGRVACVVGHGADAVEAAVEARFPGLARFARQTELLGTGHAARVGLEALSDLEGPVLILSGDVPLLEAASLEALLDEVEPGRRPVALLTTALEDPTGYGRVLRDEAGHVVRIVEHADATRAERACAEINAGVYAVDADFLRSALGRLSTDNAQGEYYLTDIVALALHDDLLVAGLEVNRAEVQGANDRAQLAALERLARDRAAARHLEAGVSLLDPESAWIQPQVEIAPDAVIHPGVHLRGRTRVGAGAVIDVGCVLTDAEIGPGARVHPYSVIESARVGPACDVGPYARLRPEAVLEAGARVGNFVEVKRSTLGEGAKANHLTYLGDARIGPGANVGAGTITCNYDGVGKHRTDIGAEVFVGSNSILVAPVRIGDASYVAAGSVVTEEVPAGSLAFGRARQVNKEGRAEAVREAARLRKASKPSGDD